eukprot:6660906-Pyramimonas_sp.AAC.2
MQGVATGGIALRLYTASDVRVVVTTGSVRDTHRAEPEGGDAVAVGVVREHAAGEFLLLEAEQRLHHQPVLLLRADNNKTNQSPLKTKTKRTETNANKPSSSLLRPLFPERLPLSKPKRRAFFRTTESVPLFRFVVSFLFASRVFVSFGFVRTRTRSVGSRRKQAQSQRGGLPIKSFFTLIMAPRSTHMVTGLGYGPNLGITFP